MRRTADSLGSIMSDCDDIVKDFLAESAESLDRLDQNLVLLEKQPDNREVLADIFRTVHNLKGTSGFLGFPKLAAVAHAGENLLSRLRDGQLSLNPQITSALLATVDTVRQMLDAISHTGTEGPGDYPELIQQLTAAQDQSAQPAGERASVPAPAPPPPPNLDNFLPEAGHLGQLLLEHGHVTRKQLARALHKQEQGDPRRLGEILVESGALSPQELDEALKADRQTPVLEESTIRIPVAQLDHLMNLVGELVLARNRLQQWVSSQNDSSLPTAGQSLNLIITALQERVMKARLQPIGNVWSKFPRMVRDVAQGCGKQVRIELEGKETGLDKSIIEAIKDPLTHLVRNAVDHGIEPPDVRIAAGKPPEGRLLLRAFHEGGQVIIEITDDGAGLNLEKIRQKAIEKGFLHADQAARTDEREIANLIFSPGLSTAEKVTKVSGRGVGMDVVKTNIEKIGGTVDVQTRAGLGTTVRLKIPLTLAIIPALIVRSGRQHYAIPSVSLAELVGIDIDKEHTAIEMIQSTPVYRLRGKLLPLVYLSRELGEGQHPSDRSDPETAPPDKHDLLDFAHARSRHLQWLQRLREVLDGKLVVTLEEAGSHEQFSLGKWIYGYGMKKYGDILEMSLLETTHRDFHALVRQVVSRNLNGDNSEAVHEYNKLGPMSRKIVELLVHIERMVLCRRKLNIVVLQANHRQFGLVVDDIGNTEEIVVKPLGKELKNLNLFAGATIMGDGDVVLILDVPGLAERARVIGEERHQSSPKGMSSKPQTSLAKEESKPVLLVRGGETDQVAIDLAAIARLEEFPRAALENSDGREFVQYRGQIMPVVRLPEAMGQEPASASEDGRLHVVVHERHGRNLGLLVNRILDIVSEPFAIEHQSTRRGVRGSALIQQRVTEVVDLPALLASSDAAIMPTGPGEEGRDTGNGSS